MTESRAFDFSVEFVGKYDTAFGFADDERVYSTLNEIICTCSDAREGGPCVHVTSVLVEGGDSATFARWLKGDSPGSTVTEVPLAIKFDPARTMHPQVKALVRLSGPVRRGKRAWSYAKMMLARHDILDPEGRMPTTMAAGGHLLHLGVLSEGDGREALRVKVAAGLVGVMDLDFPKDACKTCRKSPATPEPAASAEAVLEFMMSRTSIILQGTCLECVTTELLTRADAPTF